MNSKYSLCTVPQEKAETSCRAWEIGGRGGALRWCHLISESSKHLNTSFNINISVG